MRGCLAHVKIPGTGSKRGSRLTDGQMWSSSFEGRSRHSKSRDGCPSGEFEEGGKLGHEGVLQHR
eukprot:9496314-Pyramimonas_sp.AAC.1